MRVLLLLSVWCVLASSVCIGAVSPNGKYKVALDKMRALQQKYSHVSSMISIGEEDGGVEIFGLRVSTTPNVMDKKKIGQLVVGTHHGNEQKAPDLALHFLEELLIRYDSNELFRGNLADMEWTIIPVLNITGYNKNQRHEYNRDPNRDYPGPCTSQPGGKLKSIRNLMTVFKGRSFAGSVTIHGYIGTLTYPWGVRTTNTHSHDHNAYQSIVGKAAKENGYRHGTSTDLIYPATGTFEDWAYWKHGSWSLLVELSTGSQSDIEDTSRAMEVYFSGIDSTPSLQNQMTGECSRGGKPDLGIE